MSQKKLTAQWRGDPVVPDSYDDVAALVSLARKARKELVDFDWLLTRDEITRLREAVHSWGVTVRGRYKKFDAQVLAAINEVLEEPDSAYTLSIPKGTEWDSEVRALREGDNYRLSGHAGFDVVFGYSWVDQEPEKPDVRLGLDLARKLGDMATQLGWGGSELKSPKLQPAVNALFGNPPDYGVDLKLSDDVLTPTEPFDLTFRGPLHWSSDSDLPSIFDPPASLEKGIYLWTFRVGGEDRVHYVGQTRRNFASRLSEHLSGYLSGKYSIIDVEQLARGNQENVWQAASAGQDYGRSLTEFLRRHDELMPKLILLLDRLRFYVAPIEGEQRLFDRVEGKLGRHFLDHPDARIRKSFVAGAKFPAAIPFEKTARCRIKAEGPIAGLPEELIV